MLDILPRIRDLVAEGRTFAMAKVIKTWRSSPRPAGSYLVVTAEGDMIGSVSGGCVEGSVVSKALKVLETGEPEIAKYGVADEDAWEVGLSCGGEVWVYVQPFFTDQLWTSIDQKLLDDQGFAILTNLEHGTHQVILANDKRIDPLITDHLNQRSSGIEVIAGEELFVESFPARNKMILIGSAHITTELIELAQMYDFDTIVIDPRDTFATKTVFKSIPGRLLVNWPQEVLKDFDLDHQTYAVVLSHDPKIDDEALKILLPSAVRYIGALGSRKTHAKRVNRLKDYGFNEEQIAKIHAPIGLDIGGMAAREIALSIMAEVIKVKNVGSWKTGA